MEQTNWPSLRVCLQCQIQSEFTVNQPMLSLTHETDKAAAYALSSQHQLSVCMGILNTLRNISVP